MEGLKKLVEHRDAILLAEIGALIHDIGKLSEEFISIKSLENPLNIEKDEHASWIFEWNTKLEGVLNVEIGIRDIPLMTKKGKTLTSASLLLKELIKNHHNDKMKFKPKEFDKKRIKDPNYSKKYMVTLFSSSADGVDSGIDKGAVANINKQKIKHTYISTPFGYEFERIDVDKQELKKRREEFIKKLEEVLKEIQELKKNGAITPENWKKLRKALINSAKENFIHGLGDTRRSANDVTLWDHSYSTASLYKTALAGIILSGQWKDPSDIKWRLLAVRFNGLDYIMKSNKVGDILGRKKAIEKALNLVKDLLEVYVPAGNEVYRDENGSVFLIPEDFDESKLNDKDKECFSIGEALEISTNEKTDEKTVKIRIESSDTIKTAIEKIFEKLTYGELKPFLSISQESRGAANLGKILEEAKVHVNQPFANKIREKWRRGRDAPICKVCGLKPCKKTKAENKYLDLCEDCLNLREERAKNWYEKERSRTIWIDEVCDENGRVGLIVGSFDLTNWLNGMWLNTTFTKTLDDLRREQSDIFHEITSWEALVTAVKEALEMNNPNTEISFRMPDGNHVKIKELLKVLASEAYHGQSANELFEAIVMNREKDVIEWAYGMKDELSNEEKAKLLVLALFRKNPSFARIRRIWETTERFWDFVEEEIIEKKLKQKQRRRYRGIVEFKEIPEIRELKENNAYILKIGGMRVPIYYIGSKDNKIEFLFIESLDTLGIKIDDIKGKLKDGFEILEDSAIVTEIKQDEISAVNIKEESQYKPYIVILKEPGLFLVLLPLKECWKVIKQMKEEYEIQFSKVQNRLPIKLGLIAFKRKFPLYIVLETAKRFTNEKFNEKIFEVEDVRELPLEENCKNYDGKLGKYAIIMKLKSLKEENKNFEACVSYSLGDPNEKNRFYPFYPYFVIKFSKMWLYKEYANSLSKDYVEVSLKHVTEISPKDEILFEPSIFDFEFLDSNIRRFDVGKGRKHRLFTESGPKPYLLWDIDNFERLRKIIQKTGLTNSQVMNLYEMLMVKIEEWEMRKPPMELFRGSDEEKATADTFKKFVENAIKDVPLRLSIGEETGKGIISKEDYDFLIESILSGLFFDFVDLWHTILKLDFGGGKNGGF